MATPHLSNVSSVAKYSDMDTVSVPTWVDAMARAVRRFDCTVHSFHDITFHVYNVFVWGPTGVGKSYTARKILQDELQLTDEHILIVTPPGINGFQLSDFIPGVHRAIVFDDCMPNSFPPELITLFKSWSTEGIATINRKNKAPLKVTWPESNVIFVFTSNYSPTEIFGTELVNVMRRITLIHAKYPANPTLIHESYLCSKARQLGLSVSEYNTMYPDDHMMMEHYFVANKSNVPFSVYAPLPIKYGDTTQ